MQARQHTHHVRTHVNANVHSPTHAHAPSHHHDTIHEFFSRVSLDPNRVGPAVGRSAQALLAAHEGVGAASKWQLFVYHAALFEHSLRDVISEDQIFAEHLGLLCLKSERPPRERPPNPATELPRASLRFDPSPAQQCF